MTYDDAAHAAALAFLRALEEDALSEADITPLNVRAHLAHDMAA